MTTRGAALARADLLRALQLTQADAANRLAMAQMLGFMAQPAAAEAQPSLVRQALGQVRQALADASAASRVLPPQAVPPAVLWAVVSAERIDPPASPAQPLQSLRQADCAPRRRKGTPFSPLVRPSQRWPVLRRALQQPHQAGIDVPALVTLLAAGRLPARIPAQTRTHWGQALWLVWDKGERMQPYQEDWCAIVDDLLRHRPREGLQAFTVAGRPDALLGADPGSELPLPQPGTVVLVLSDMGALAADPADARAWLLWLQRTSRAGAHVVNWAPMAPQQLGQAQARLADVYCLVPGAVPRHHRGAWHDAAGRRAALENLQQLVQSLWVRASCCVQLEPKLLRALRNTDPALRAQPGLEAWAWTQQPLVGSSRLSRPLAPPAAAVYRQLLHRLPVAQRLAVLQAMLEVHAASGRSTECVEASLWATHAGLPQPGLHPAWASRLTESQQWLQRMARDMALGLGPGGPARASFAQDLLRRQAADARWLGQNSAWLADVFAASNLVDAPAGLQARDLARSVARRPAGAPIRCRLVQHGAQLWLWPAGQPLAWGASPLADGLLADHVIVQTPGGPAHSLPAAAQPQPLAALVRQVPAFDVLLASHALRVQGLLRPRWAQEWGRDQTGLWADLAAPSGKNTVARQRFRWIAPGSFWMGSPDDEHQRGKREGPRHVVTITRGFWLADSACTQALWQAVMGKNPSEFKGDTQRPVDSVSWDDVQGFLKRLQAMVPGCEAVLPTEAMWEYACRAGTETPFSFGDDITPEQVNYDGNYPYQGGKKGLYREAPVAVKSLPANAWGLHEMHGNVWEWCADGQRSYDGRAQVDPEGPSGLSEDGHRVLRGGSWAYHARDVRSAQRYAFPPGIRFQNFGFRLCLRSIEPGPGTRGTAGRDGPPGPGGPLSSAPGGRPKLDPAASPAPTKARRIKRQA